MRKLVFLLLINVICLSALAQQKGSLIIRTLPSNAVVYINDQKFENNGTAVPFDTGNFKVKIWSMEYDLFTDTFIVAPGEPTIIRVKLSKLKHNVAESVDGKDEKESVMKENPLIEMYLRKQIWNAVFFLIS